MTSGPREIVKDAVLACLAQIRSADGYHTDAGATATPEPGQVPMSATSALSVVVGRQQRATQEALLRTHRLTDLDVVIKVPVGLDDAQARMDAAVSDVERAMEPTPANQARFPRGYTFPQYAEMRPLHPDPPANGWIGALLIYQTHIPIR